MSEVRGFQRSQRQDSGSDFIVVNSQTSSFATEAPEVLIVDADTGVTVGNDTQEEPSIKDSQIFETFGQVNPILSSGEWQEDELLEPPALKSKGLLGMFLNLFYS